VDQVVLRLEHLHSAHPVEQVKTFRKKLEVRMDLVHQVVVLEQTFKLDRMQESRRIEIA
jgi:hypothetical protein